MYLKYIIIMLLATACTASAQPKIRIQRVRLAYIASAKPFNWTVTDITAINGGEDLTHGFIRGVQRTTGFLPLDKELEAAIEESYKPGKKPILNNRTFLGPKDYVLIFDNHKQCRLIASIFPDGLVSLTVPHTVDISMGIFQNSPNTTGACLLLAPSWIDQLNTTLRKMR